MYLQYIVCKPSNGLVTGRNVLCYKNPVFICSLTCDFRVVSQKIFPLLFAFSLPLRNNVILIQQEIVFVAFVSK